MYEPQFNYTDKLVSNLIKLENNKTIIQTLDLPYEARNKLYNRTKAQNLFHLAHMLNLNITIKDAERILTGVIPQTDDPAKRDILVNFRNAEEFIRSPQADNFAEFDKTIIVELNKILVLNWRETWDAKYRNFNEKLDPRWDSFASLVDPEVKAKDLDLLMTDLIEWYKAANPTLTPIIKIAILFYRLIEICPFIAANKITILTILDNIFLKNQMSSKIYASVFKNVDQNDEAFIEAFSMSRKNHELTYWLETFTELMIKELVDVRESINDFVAEEEKSKKQPFLDLNKRQMKILKYLQTVPVIKREDYCHMMEVSTMTAFRDLNDLVRKKLVKIEGQGRGTKYKLANM